MADKEINLARIAAQQEARDIARGKKPVNIVDIVTAPMVEKTQDELKDEGFETEKPKKSKRKSRKNRKD